ncbi:MAG: gfo/Idh/MocA family oxidoreductase [Planctomycetia bacterium]|nr:gfo/Idh/MocA family oxidoreductase [Planctomycetia bacterium]
MTARFHRRTLLRSGLTTGLGAAVAAGTAPAFIPARAFGANERIVIGGIGVGNQGSGLVRSFAKRASVAAISDVYLPRAEAVAGEVGAGSVHQDYRALLDRKDVDAVIVATPHHWHALCCVHAAQAGKDIYCEKPLAYSIVEGRKIVEAVRGHRRVLQTGMQQRSGGKEQAGCRLVRGGALGTISRVIASTYASPMDPDFPEQPVPAGLDWDRWCGPADLVPFNKVVWDNRSDPSWVSLRPFSGGAMTDWGAHGLDMAQWGLGMDDTGPDEVWVEGEPFQPQRSTPEQPGGRQKGPSTPKVFMRYPGDILLEFAGGPQFGVTFVGEKGRLTLQRGGFKADPPDLAADPAVAVEPGPDHHQNWLDCIKSRQDPVANVEVGQRSTSLGHLANIARWVSGLTGETGKRLRWDAAAERFTNSDEANRFLARPARAGYTLPDHV